MMARLWSIFAEKKDCSNTHVADILSTQSAIMQFRFVTGIRARTVTQIQSLNDWAKRHGEDIGVIPGCGEHFDIDIPDLKPDSELPRKVTIYANLLLVIFLIACLLFLVAAANYDKAVVKMNGSEVWFALDETSASPFQGSKKGFFISQCPTVAKNLGSNSGFTKAEVENICASFVDKSAQASIKSTIDSQKEIAVPFAISVGIFIYVSFRPLRYAVGARIVARRRRKSAQRGQPVLRSNEERADTQD